MMDAKQFSDQTKQLVSDWQKKLEEMQVQFSLGKMDAVDAFEKQKEQYRAALLTLKENLDKGQDLAEEKTAEMKAKMEELRLQLSLGKADGMDAFEEQKKKIELAMHEFYVSYKATFNDAFNKSVTMFDHNAEAFKTGLEIIKMQFSLAKMDAKDELKDKQKEISDKMIELNQQFKTIQQTAMENVDEMNKQLRENFEKMKAYAEGWTKK
ncbi:MAG: hypothetical protein CFE21_04100 [Bacteroidetes bacterium B1(2017)]|nr:MAG: hypothetical protein CFE21_04100 [Bacteroidetes bacterium B1(2017)]